MTGILVVAWNGALFSMIHIGMIISKRLRTIGAFDFNAMGKGTKTDFSILDKESFVGCIVKIGRFIEPKVNNFDLPELWDRID